MSDNLDNLRKIAEAATPGPWETLGGQGPFGTHAVCHRMEQGTLVEIAYRDAHFDKANAVHIATFYPPTVLALLTRLEQAEQAVQRVRDMSAHRKEIRLDYVDLIDLDLALDGHTRRCAECNGTGDVQVRFAHGVQAQDCASCFGSGESNE